MARRAGAWSRHRAAQVRTAIWQAHRRLIIIASICYVCLTAALITAAAALVGRELAWFLAGAAVVAFPTFIKDIFVNNEYRRLSEAALAEEFTSSELRPLRLKGWKTIDRIEFDHYDVDHVAVGPAGVFVIETKNTNHDWTLLDKTFSNEWAITAEKQARQNGDRIRALLKQKVGREFDVQAVLMIWGDGRPRLDRPTPTRRRVTVVTGSLLREHLAGGAPALDAQQISDVSRALRNFIANKETLDRTRLATV